MIDPRELDAWLTSVNARYRTEEIPPYQRPFEAFRDFSQEFNCSFSLDSSIAKSIIDWFYDHSAPGSHAIGSLFTGAFFFDACFWPLHIPMGYGRFALNAFDCLSTMPPPVKEQVRQSSSDIWRLALYWADCFDYGFGLNDIRHPGKLSERTLAFLINGDRELAGAIAQLVLPRPNPKAILSLRMSCEIFMKALLVQERKLNDSQLRKLGHKVGDIANECFMVTNLPEFEVVAKAADIFPDVSDRYDGSDRRLSDIWEALGVTQIAATAVIRKYSGRDMRPQIFAA